MLLLLACVNTQDTTKAPVDTDTGTVAADADLDGWTAAEGDCDEADPDVFPGATELCNGVDDDCDAAVDEGVLVTFYADADGDGAGDEGASVEACAAEAGFVQNANDCDDVDPDVHPGAEERCNGLDDDCDGAVDDGLIVDVWADGDGDGYGDVASPDALCDIPPGWVENAEDCDDADPAINPRADEVCNDLDDDCDGAVDDGASGKSTWYGDSDGDGYGAAISIEACAQPAGYAATDDDCDDADSSVFPGADERCNSRDDDCDGGVDEGAVDPATWYLDADGDGHGDAADFTAACDAPRGYAGVGDDCDDADADQFPGNTESCDGADENCDGLADDGGVCPCPVDYYDGGTYMFCEGPTDGVTARTNCIANNYHLVRVDDASEDAWLRSTAPTYGIGDWWIGLTDELFEGLFGWVWGASTVPYTNWASGEPNDVDGEDCVTLSYGALTWVDQDCSVATTYVCEAD